jgi:hypothetical protein
VQQDELLRHAIEALERLAIPYMVVGSLASGAYGEPRLTQDIDIVVAPTTEELDALCDAFDPNEFYLSREAARQARLAFGHFNVLDPSSGNKIDFMIARNDGWGRAQLARRQRMRLLPDREGFTARPEDLILSKMLYYQEGGSEKHLRDITGMFKVSGEQIDREYIHTWAQTLGVSDVWEAIANRLRPG